MNDPGLDGPIEEEAKRIDGQGGSPKDAAEHPQNLPHDLTPFLQPTRWWLASTAFPLIAVCEAPIFGIGESEKLNFSVLGHSRADGQCVQYMFVGSAVEDAESGWACTRGGHIGSEMV